MTYLILAFVGWQTAEEFLSIAQKLLQKEINDEIRSRKEPMTRFWELERETMKTGE